MWLPRVRFTVRQLMVAVAVVAVAIGGLVGVRGAWQYVMALDRVRYHSGMENWLRWFLDQIDDDQSQVMAHDALLTEEARRAMRDAGGDERLSATLDDVRRSDELSRATLDEYRRIFGTPASADGVPRRDGM
jgi:hypothetical protein